MIKANHNIFAGLLYRFYIRKLFKSNFKKFIIVNEIPDINNCNGLIITPNHFSWWDGFFIEAVMRHFTNRKLFIMMFEEQLKRYWFFRFLGAFSIKLNSISSVKESFEYSKKIISSSSNFLVFYPQGEIQPYDKNKIKLKRGLKKLTENNDSCILIVSFRITYGTDKKPSVYCRFGELLNSDNFILTEYEQLFKNNLDLLDKYMSEIYELDLLNR